MPIHVFGCQLACISNRVSPRSVIFAVGVFRSVIFVVQEKQAKKNAAEKSEEKLAAKKKTTSKKKKFRST